ncbi:MAG TPA: hypothetical protein VE988_07110, partial [Gemmataceae bacterium]|nr:hypothetical protein [Gemmataceae bacterium]
MNTLFCRSLSLGLGLVIVCLPALFAQAPANAPVKVTIDDDKTEISDRVLPLDPVIRVAYEYVGSMSFGVNGEGKRLTCGAG